MSMTPSGTARHETRTTVYLSLGSNLGDRLVYLREALNSLERHPHIVIDAVSSVYETDPVGMTEQPAFLNIVIRVKTSLEPYTLLHMCQEIENQFQREREIRWGPRTLDIDLLIYDDLTLATEELTLPHPRMQEREFVQIPLRDLQTGEIGVSQGVRPLYTNWYKT
jgi:2-amino-4-hydroxy-6-hydroxymethyldihydropteridine diphosphokinase